MSTGHIALLRAVNLGSHNKVAMAELRTCLEAQGFSGVRTLLQSGNIVFGGTRRSWETVCPLSPRYWTWASAAVVALGL